MRIFYYERLRRGNPCHSHLQRNLFLANKFMNIVTTALIHVRHRFSSREIPERNNYGDRGSLPLFEVHHQGRDFHTMLENF